MKFAAESGATHDCGEAVLFLSYRRSILLAGKTARLRPNFVTNFKKWTTSLKKWEETLDYVSCFSLHFFRALAASCVLYNRTEHSQGFSIC